MTTQAASDLGISSDPRLREALDEDETRIATHLMSILDSQAAKEAVLALEGDAAQHFLDVIQHVAWPILPPTLDASDLPCPDTR
jgi:hypothetical protein